MTERERLIELLKSDSCESPMLCDPNCKYASLKRCYEERTADYLLENGVIILPCKIGDYCKIAKRLTADNSGEGDIKIRYSAVETAQLIGIACVTVNENGTQIMDISNVFALKESEENA